MLFDGISRCFEAFELLLLFYFFAWVFVCPIFHAFSNYAKNILCFMFSAEILLKESRVYLALMSVSSISYDLIL